MNAKNPIPETEGIKYAGSKQKILPYILDIIADLEVKSVLDGFSGSTRVSQAFSKLGYDTTSSDISEWSATFATCYILNKRNPQEYAELIEHLNALLPIDGWFTEFYGGNLSTTEKRPFQQKNTRKLDAIRTEIDLLGLDETQKAVALTSLILALDRVDSTLGHFASYLADWSPRSHKEIVLKLPNLHISQGNNTVIKGDIFDTVQNRTFDLAYFDPPYGSNNEKMPPSRIRYASYYHIWTSVIRNDKPTVFGKVNRRVDSRDSVAASQFEEFRKDENGQFIALQTIKQLIEKTSAKYILLSYSSGGRATKAELSSILQASGKLLRVVEIDYKKNVMGAMRWTNEWVNSDGAYQEYLFLLKKH